MLHTLKNSVRYCLEEIEGVSWPLVHKRRTVLQVLRKEIPNDLPMSAGKKEQVARRTRPPYPPLGSHWLSTDHREECGFARHTVLPSTQYPSTSDYGGGWMQNPSLPQEYPTILCWHNWNIRKERIHCYGLEIVLKQGKTILPIKKNQWTAVSCR